MERLRLSSKQPKLRKTLQPQRFSRPAALPRVHQSESALEGALLGHAQMVGATQATGPTDAESPGSPEGPNHDQLYCLLNSPWFFRLMGHTGSGDPLVKKHHVPKRQAWTEQDGTSDVVPRLLLGTFLRPSGVG